MYTFNYIDNDIEIKSYIGKDEYNNNIVINKDDKTVVLKYNEYNNKEINKNTHKGIKKSLCLKHDEYSKSLYKEQLIYKEYYNLQLNKQNIYLDKINKIALNPMDSKRCWINNINSLPYGH